MRTYYTHSHTWEWGSERASCCHGAAILSKLFQRHLTQINIIPKPWPQKLTIFSHALSAFLPWIYFIYLCVIGQYFSLAQVLLPSPLSPPTLSVAAAAVAAAFKSRTKYSYSLNAALLVLLQYYYCMLLLLLQAHARCMHAFVYMWYIFRLQLQRRTYERTSNIHRRIQRTTTPSC